MGRFLFILLQYVFLAGRLLFIFCLLPITVFLSLFVNGRQKTVDQLFEAMCILFRSLKGTWNKFSADYEAFIFMKKLHRDYHKNLKS